MKRITIFVCFLLLAPIKVHAQVSVTTHHNDNSRTGQNPNETMLTPANVNTNYFGRLFSQPVDGAIYAQPLYVPNVSIAGKGTHNVVFVETEHDSVYAFDADNNSGANASPLWQVSFINPAAGITTVPNADVNCADIQPEIGITGTPVIDTSTGTLYVVAKTKENATYVQRLHALDITSGAEKFGGPVAIVASVSGTGTGNINGNIAFSPQWQNQRLSLLLQNGLVYIGWGSHCSLGNGPYHGWIMAYEAGTLHQVGVWNDTPNDREGGIWESGEGPAGDSAFNTYFSTGSPGIFDADIGKTDFGQSIVKLGPPANGTFPVADYFTPYNQSALESADADISSSGLVLIEQPATAPVQHLVISGGKSGTIYLLNRDNLGRFNPGGDTQIIQELPGAAGSIFSTPAWWNGSIYIGGVNDVLKAFSLSASTGLLSTTPTSVSTTSFKYPGPTPSISANGNSNAIVWALQNEAWKTNGQAILHAYNATNLANELYSTNQNAALDAPGAAVKFTAPTVADGKVFVGTQTQVSVYGLFAGFGVSASPAQQSIVPGTSATFTVQVSGYNNFNGTVNLSVNGLPPSATSSFSPASIAGPGQSILTITTSVTTPSGIYPLSIVGSSGSSTTPAVATLEVNPYPGSLQINSGGGAVGTWLADEDFSGGNLGITTATIDTSAVTNPAPMAVYRSERWGVFTYTIPRLTPGGTYTVRLHFAELAFSTVGARVFSVAINGTTVLSNFDIFATAGARNKALVEQFTSTADGTGTITIAYQKGPADYPKSSGIEIIPGASSSDFSVSATPASQSVAAGGSTTYTVTVGSLGGFSGVVTLSVSGQPAGATPVFSPSSVTGSGTSTLTVTTTSSTAGGTYPLTITGTSGSTTHTASVSVTILQPAATPTFSPPAGTYDSAQSVTLSDTTSGASIYYTTDGTTPTTSSTLYNNVAIPVNSTETIKAIAVATGFTQSAVGSATYTIQAPPPPDFSVSATPASRSVAAGGSTTYTVTVGSLNGFGGMVGLSVSGLPAGATPVFSPSSVTGSGTSTLTVTTTTSTASGTYPLTITGTSGSLTHTTSITLTITPQPNFSLSASPSSLSIPRGGSGTSTITVNPLNGFGGSVSLSASGFSKGVSASFNPSTTTTTSILTLTASSTASLGNFTVTVTGTSGSLSHTTTISLKVTQH